MFRNRMKYHFFGWLLVLQVLAVALLMVVGSFSAAWKASALRNNRELVEALGLTDLAIWTEARYTRHPSQADFFSAFQDSPGALEHFPAGHLLPLPVSISVQSPIPADVEAKSDRENESAS